jgi:hypothetical protein
MAADCSDGWSPRNCIASASLPGGKTLSPRLNIDSVLHTLRTTKLPDRTATGVGRPARTVFNLARCSASGAPPSVKTSVRTLSTPMALAMTCHVSMYAAHSLALGARAECTTTSTRPNLACAIDAIDTRLRRSPKAFNQLEGAGRLYLGMSPGVKQEMLVVTRKFDPSV